MKIKKKIFSNERQCIDFVNDIILMAKSKKALKWISKKLKKTLMWKLPRKIQL